jgi:hypothetical protein
MGFLGQLFGGAGLSYQPSGATPQQVNLAMQASQNAIGQQQNFINALQAAGGAAPQLQGQLAQQLAAQARGEGPNVAQAQLAEATAANAARQAALMASQRGAGANVGSIARLASQAGQQAQQTAIGQAATLRAQQQLAAQQALGQLTGQTISQQQAALQQYGGLTAEQQRQLMASQAEQNRIQAQLAIEKSRAQQAAIGGVMNVAGQAALMAMAPQSAAASVASQTQMSPSQSAFNQGPVSYSLEPGSRPDQAVLTTTSNYANGGMVQEPILPPMRFGSTNTGSILGDYVHTGYFADGGLVPGKAQFGGDDGENDTVHAMLSPGEIVIPRSIVNGPNAAEKSKKFVQAILAKKRLS